jgi:Zn-finger nucleic acid-binding protein
MVEKYIIDDENYCGECPECKASWDKGEVVDLVGEKTAKEIYGWTPDNKKHMSKLIKIEPTDSQAWEGLNNHYQCPECFIAWDSVTGDRTEKYKIMTVDNGVMKSFMERLKKP